MASSSTYAFFHCHYAFQKFSFFCVTLCNPNYQCLKIKSCRWRPPPRMHSFTATTHFKGSRSFVSPCVCCMLCRMRLCRILQSMQFLSIIFFSWISSIFIWFFKSSSFLCHSVSCGLKILLPTPDTVQAFVKISHKLSFRIQCVSS